MKKGLLYIGLLSMGISTYAQDYHLSQFEESRMLLNPAMTGMFQHEKVDFKAGIHYRDQWKAISSNSFVKAMAYYEMTYKKRFGMGAYIISDRAGDGNFGTLNFLLSGTYDIMNDMGNDHDLSVGLQLGMINRSLDPNKLTFDSQYSQSTGGFDQAIPSGENFVRTSLWGFDANLGIFYKYSDESKDWHPYGGLVFSHLTMPKLSFYDATERTPIRLTFHGGAEIRLDEKWSIKPALLFMMQAKAWELNIGMYGSYKIQESPYKLLFGLAYRVKDAAILHLGCQFRRHAIRLSYDFNTSYLNNYTGGRGGFEISMVYSGLFKDTQYPRMVDREF